MKNAKRILALVLSLGLMLGFLSPVQVKAANDGSITVDNPKVGETYTLYRVFDLVLSPDEAAGENTTYLYTAVNDTLKTTISDHDTYKALATKKTSDGKMVINEKPLLEGTLNAYDFSNWLSGLAVGNFTKQGDSITVNAEGDTVKWDNLPLGYYMVKSSLGTLVSLNTTDKVVTIHEKNPDADKLQLTKKVSGGVDGAGAPHTGFVKTNGTYGKNVYASIGEELTYQITFNVHAYANKEYVLNDVLPAGLSLGTDAPIVKLGTDSMTTETTGTDQTKKYTYAKEEQTQTFTFSKETIQAIAKSIRDADTSTNGAVIATTKTITISYKAKLNDQADMSNNGGLSAVDGKNTNKVTLTYDKKSQTEPLTVEDKVTVRTTDFNIFKYEKDTNAEAETALADAKFKIYTVETEGTALGFTQVTGQQSYNYTSVNGDTEITTDANGEFNIRGLKPGTYYIEETAAPTGYNKIQDRIKLEIKEAKVEGTDKIQYIATIEGVGGDTPLNDNIVKVLNQKGAKLPETGGIGRTIIYTIGAILFFGALVLLVARRRSREERA